MENKALWIFPNFLEAINELPEGQRGEVWRAICEYGLGQEIDINKLTKLQKVTIKMILPLLKLRNTGGSLKKGDVQNPQGLNGKNKLNNCVNHCKNTKSEDNPYPNPSNRGEDNPFKEQEQEQEQEQEDNIKFFSDKSSKNLNLSPPDVEKNEKIPKNADYAFDGKIIRLSKRDFGAWEKAYSCLDLVAELQARDDWLSSQDPPVNNWFITTSNYLRKRNEQVRKEAENEEEPTKWITSDW